MQKHCTMQVHSHAGLTAGSRPHGLLCSSVSTGTSHGSPVRMAPCSPRPNARSPSTRCSCAAPAAPATTTAATTTTRTAPTFPPASATLSPSSVSSIVPSTLISKQNANGACYTPPGTFPSTSPRSPLSTIPTTTTTIHRALPSAHPNPEPSASLSAPSSTGEGTATPSPSEEGHQDLRCIDRAPAELPLCHVPRHFLQHYELQTLIGAGEYGRVWRAIRLHDETLHAVKIMPKQRPDRTKEENLKRIECELSIWRQCQASKFVCKLEEVFQDDENVYVVQELCAGGDLRKLMAEGPISELQTAHIMRAVLDVVSICHSSNCTFGDIKPANFLLKEPLLRDVPTCMRSGPFASMATTGTMASMATMATLATMGTMDADPHPHSDSHLHPHMSTHSGSGHASGSDTAATHGNGNGNGNGSVHAANGTGSGIGDASECERTSASAGGNGSAAAAPYVPPTAVPSIRATDFGFSYRCDQAQGSHQHTGSPVYMAPELWGVGQECGPASDVWAAGVMMYQLLCGQYPFWETPATSVDRLPMYQVMLAVTSNPIYMHGPAWEKVSRPAKDLVMAMLDRDSTTRITVDKALCHPWFRRMLGYSPQPSTLQLDAACRNN